MLPATGLLISDSMLVEAVLFACSWAFSLLFDWFEWVFLETWNELLASEKLTQSLALSDSYAFKAKIDFVLTAFAVSQFEFEVGLERIN